MQRFNFVSGTGSDLYKKPLTAIDYNTSEGGTGHVGFICHKQPALERAIRDVIATNEFSELRTRSTILAIEEDANHVYVQYSDADRHTRRLQAPFLVGADGKTGFVRKKYLEAKGVYMERCEGYVRVHWVELSANGCGSTSYEETWVALNWQISLPTEKTHPDFPLWRLGYSPQEVYELFFPQEFRFLCNSNRPAVCGRFGLPEDRLWRFEFVVRKGEDGNRMATLEETSKVIYPYITHPGSRYGLPHAVRFPDNCITTLRSRPFSFSARSCNKWALGRVAIAGDAAHVFPPFGGQGIASGFRDASALAWRLALLQREPNLDHQELLRGWYIERKQQLERSLAATIQNGKYVTESNPVKVLFRDWYLWGVQLVPSWRRELEKGPRAFGTTQYQFSQGLPFLPDMLGGMQLAQVYAWSLDRSQLTFSDDLIFHPSKQGLFQLLLLPENAAEARTLFDMIQHVTNASEGHVVAEEATCLIQDISVRYPTSPQDTKIARLASGEEFAADQILCKNRPPPIHYDPFRLKKQVKGKKILIVRPDRFLYAACSSQAELLEALRRLLSTLSVQ